MANDLTSSPIDRQNVLNNRYALEKIKGIQDARLWCLH